MSVRTPTPEQREALEADVGVALSSGAGCGKTTVLTDRFLRALEERRPLDRLVAVTFTEKAAAEMRQRIRSRCRERADAGDADADYWRRVLRGLEAGRIGTFHGFCLDLLKRYAVQAGLPPEFAVLDEAVAPTLRDEALRGLIRRWLAEGHPDLVALAVELGLDAVREGLRSLLTGRALADPGRWAALEAEDLIRHWNEAWEAEGRPAVLRNFVDDARPCLELLRSNQCEHRVGAIRRAALLAEIPMLPIAPRPDLSFDEIREAAKVSGGGGGKDWPSIDVFEQVKERYTNLRGAVDRTRKRLNIDDALTRRSAELGVRFARLASEVQREVDRLKQRREAADFEDLLVRARDLLLGQESGVLETLRSEIDLLLVDEFQDTDPIQGAIVRALAGEDPSDARLFLVGDSKQSIYRFRGAAPRIFEEFRDDLPPEGRLALTGNFRSVPGVIDFVNALFRDLYDAPEEALRAEHQVERGEEDAPAVEFLWPFEQGASTKRPTVADRRRTEARWIARLLADRLERGWMIRVPKEGVVREARAGDVAILFRAMTTAGVYEAALADEGIDSHTFDGSAFFAQQEVLDVVNLLAAIEDPFDPLALAASLRSPCFGVSDLGLYWLANARLDDRPADLARNLRRGDEVAELSRADRRRAVRARDLLERWRGAKDRVSVAALLDRVLDESGLEAALVAEPMGDRRRANVRKLVRLASQYDRGGFPLADYVARLRTDQRQLAREDQAATNTEAGDAVRLMSIHRAKGQEFPVVIVPDLDRKAPPMSRGVVIHPRHGPIVRADLEPGASPPPWAADDRPRSLGEQLYRASEDRMERDEADRLFYVAATRAQSHLILSSGLAATAADHKPEARALELLAERFDLQTGRLRGEIPEGWPEPRVGVIADAPGRRSSRGGALRKRADRLDVVRTITRTAPVPMAPLEPSWPAPSWVEHDPAEGLTPFASRVDALIRRVLHDPEASWAADPLAAIERAARGTVPASPPRVSGVVREVIGPWFEGALAHRIAAAEERRAGVSWTLGDARGAVHRGAIDLAFREGGLWHLVALELSGGRPGVGERRLALGSRASAVSGSTLGLGRIVERWLVRFSVEAGPSERLFDGRRLSRTIAVEIPAPTAKGRAPRRATAAGAVRTEPDHAPQ